MIGEYTQEAFEQVFDLLEKDSAQMWADIEQLPTDTATDLWRKKLEQILFEYMLSSRFSLMRIIHNRVLVQCRAQHKDDRVPDGAEELHADDTRFSVLVGGKWVTFSDITISHAERFTPEEHLNYLTYLLQLANPASASEPSQNRQIIMSFFLDKDPKPDPDPLEVQQILFRAWLDEESANQLAEYLLSEKELAPKKKEKARSNYQKKNRRIFKTMLTREEALRMGHILNFSLEEMQWFMLHTLDVEEGFQMTKADDLIEVFCFRTNASWKITKALKEEYAKLPACEDKLDETVRNDHWTQKTTNDLFEKIESWKYRPETQNTNFLNWLENQAPGLDVPSHTARNIYRNLAASAYQLALGVSDELDDGDVIRYIQRICDTQESEAVHTYLFDSQGISETKCQTVAKRLLLENKERSASSQPDNAVPWSVITTCKDGELSSSYGRVNQSRTRVEDLLLGKTNVEKADLLFLLWFLLNLLWFEDHIDDANALCCRLLDLKDSARILLKAANLPPFFVPHLMEQTMILSIIYGGKTSVNPTEVYEQCLQAVKKTRNRKSKTVENAPSQQ